MSKSENDAGEARDPWAKLTRPSPGSGAFSRLRVSAEYPRDLFWALDVEARPMLMLVLGSNPPEDARPPRLREIEFRVVSIGGGAVITVLLTAAERLDLFRVFCTDLHQAVGHVGSDDEAVRRLFARAARWHHFMRAGSGRALSDREQRGLFAELTVLQELAAPAIGMAEAVAAWRGPFREHQDFVAKGYRVEVKSTEPQSPRAFEVSSERQLDQASVDGDRLSLAFVEISRADGYGGESLAELVAAIRHECERTSQAVRADFDARLAASGYTDQDVYDVARWEAREPAAFEVDAAFPAIRASELPSSITRVRYTCDLSGVELRPVHNPFHNTREND